MFGLRIEWEQHERVEVIIEGKVYVVVLIRNRPQLVFSHLTKEED